MTDDELKNHPLRLLTIEEAAEVLRIAPRTLREHIARGEIRYVAVGCGRIRPRKMFARSDLEDFIRRQSRTERPVVRNARDGRRRASPPEPPPAPKPAAPRPLPRTKAPLQPRRRRNWITDEHVRTLSDDGVESDK